MQINLSSNNVRIYLPSLVYESIEELTSVACGQKSHLYCCKKWEPLLFYLLS